MFKLNLPMFILFYMQLIYVNFKLAKQEAYSIVDKGIGKLNNSL